MNGFYFLMQFHPRLESPKRNRSKKGTIKGFLTAPKARPPTMLIANSFHYYSSPFISLHMKLVHLKQRADRARERGAAAEQLLCQVSPTTPPEQHLQIHHHPLAPPAWRLPAMLPNSRQSSDLPHPATRPRVFFLQPHVTPIHPSPDPAVLLPNACSSACHPDI